MMPSLLLWFAHGLLAIALLFWLNGRRKAWSAHHPLLTWDACLAFVCLVAGLGISWFMPLWVGWWLSLALVCLTSLGFGLALWRELRL